MSFKRICSLILFASAALAVGTQTFAADFVVYSVYRGINFGNPGENPEKDFYINVGRVNGARVGEVLEVWRKTPTYDLTTEKLFTDVTFPIARIKLIHVDEKASIARLEKMMPEAQTPAIVPNAVMIGDIVRASR